MISRKLGAKMADCNESAAARSYLYRRSGAFLAGMHRRRFGFRGAQSRRGNVISLPRRPAWPTTIDVALPVDAEVAQHLDTPERREAVGRYLKAGRVCDVLAEAIAGTKRETHGRARPTTKSMPNSRLGRQTSKVGRRPRRLKLVSAALERNNLRERALLHAVAEPNRLILSQEVEDEHPEVIFRPKFDRFVAAEPSQRISSTSRRAVEGIKTGRSILIVTN